MFTGLVEGLGTIAGSDPVAGGLRLRVMHPGWSEGLGVGASVAVEGCCLTVVAADPAAFEVDVTRATLERTRFRDLRPGSPVNLERPLAVGGRLGGHWVQGHVDGVLRVERVEGRGETRYLDLIVPDEARELVVPRGSIALDGVSLTVHDAGGDPHAARIAIIPHTWTSTTLSRLRPGDGVHVEYDVLARYATAARRSRFGADVSFP
ncbi:MAG: riboflavin synthase [Gemmatimonadota bacterium]